MTHMLQPDCSCLTCKIRFAIVSNDANADLQSGWFRLCPQEALDALGEVLIDVLAEFEDEAARAAVAHIYGMSRIERERGSDLLKATETAGSA